MLVDIRDVSEARWTDCGEVIEREHICLIHDAQTKTTAKHIVNCMMNYHTTWNTSHLEKSQ